MIEWLKENGVVLTIAITISSTVLSGIYWLDSDNAAKVADKVYEVKINPISKHILATDAKIDTLEMQSASIDAKLNMVIDMMKKEFKNQ